MGSLADSKRSYQDAKDLVVRARNLVDSTLEGLEQVNNEIKVGIDISKFLSKRDSIGAISVSKVCFSDTLENAAKSNVKFTVDLSANGKSQSINVKAALDNDVINNLADALSDKLYPGFSDFSKKIDSVKLLFSNLDEEKAAITKALSSPEPVDEKESGKR